MAFMLESVSREGSDGDSSPSSGQVASGSGDDPGEFYPVSNAQILQIHIG